MALEQLNLGSSANDGTGTEQRPGGQIINDAIASIGIIQYVFQDISAGDVTNTSDTVPVNTGLEVAITPKFADSSLIVSFHGDWEFVSAQEGCQIQYEYSDDNYSTSTFLTASLYQYATGSQRRIGVSGKIEIPNPDKEIKIRIVFKAQTTAQDSIFKGTRGAFMDVSEIQA